MIPSKEEDPRPIILSGKSPVMAATNGVKFKFKDIAKLTDQEARKFLREVDTKDLTASPGLPQRTRSKWRETTQSGRGFSTGFGLLSMLL